MNEKTLIIGPSWVGDMVMAQVLFKVLKTRSDHPIDVLAPKWSAPIVKRMQEVSSHIDMPIGHGTFGLAKRYQIGKRLRNEGYTRAYILPNSFKSALIPYFAKIPKRIGFKGECRYGLINDRRHLDKVKLPLMIDRFASLGFAKNEVMTALPRPHLTVNQAQVEQVLLKFYLLDNAPIIALCPGAEFGASKRWPIEHFAKTANHFLDQGMQVWLFGSKGDEKVAKAICEQTSQRAVNLAGKTSLDEAIDLLSKSNCVITNDSGLMHVAAALNKPLVAMYGSSSPSFTPPLIDTKFIYQTNLKCSPCFKRECPLNHHACMKQLEPSPVIETVQGWLG